MIRNSRRMVALAVAGAVAIAPVISGCGAGEDPQSAAPTQLTDGVNISVPTDKPENAQVVLRNVFLLGPKPGEPISAGSSLALYGVVINQVKGGQDRLVSVSSTLFKDAKVDDGRGLPLPAAAPDGTGTPVRLLGKPAAKKAPAPATTTPTAPEGGEKKTKKPGATPSAQEPQDNPAAAPSGTGATPEASTSPTPGNAGGGAQESTAPTTPTGEQALVVLTGLTQEVLAGTQVPVRLEFENAGAVDFQVPIVPQQGEYSGYPLASAPVTPAPASPNPGGAPQPSGSATPPRTGSPEQPDASQSPAAGGETPGASGH
ncbi:MAG: hypothetical protein ACRDNL_19935 [Spirillospora sp.]